MRELWEEALLALRALRRAPAFSLTVISTLALALGGVTAIFSVLYGVVLQPLPFPRPSELLVVEGNFGALSLMNIPVSPRELLELRERSKAFVGLGGYVAADMNLTGLGESRRISAAQSSPSLLRDVIAVKPAYGRLFDDEEGLEGKNEVVILGAGFHRRAFGGDPNVVGTTLELDGKAHRIVGILPDSCDKGMRARADGRPHDVWVPLWFPAERLEPAARGGRYVATFGRLAPGQTKASAGADVKRIGQGFEDEFPSSYRKVAKYSITVRPMREYFVSASTPVLYLLFGAVLMVLLAASANVASLTLARVAVRQRELAARAALGATSGRLAMHVLVESGVVAAIGGLLGLVVGRMLLDLLLGLQGPAVPWAGEAGLDGPVLATAALFTLVAGLASGLVPAFHVARLPPAEVLKEGTRSSGGRRTGRMRALLVAAQVAVSLALLSGALVLVRSLGSLLETPLGFDTNGVTVANLSLAPAHYPDDASQARIARQVAERLAASPGVEAAGLTTTLPLSGWSDYSFEVEGEPIASDGLKPVTQVRAIEGRYFEALGVDLLEGRNFTVGDVLGNPRVAIVNQTLAKKYLHGEALTKSLRMRMGFTGGEELIQVIGVVEDTRDMGIDEAPHPFAFFPFAQRPVNGFNIAVRSSTLDEAGAAGVIRAAVNGVDPRQPLFGVQPLETIVRDSLAPRRMALMLFGAFALVGVLLAVLGVYGVTAYSVSQRTQELGVRLALGADESSLVVLVVGQALRVVGGGLVAGVILAVILGRVLAASLAAVEPFDATAVFVVAVGLLVAGALASYLPARRVARLELSHALRAE